MERLNWHIADELAKRSEVRAIVPIGAAMTALSNSFTVDEVPLSPLWRFFLSSIGRSLRATRKWRPDFVFSGSGLAAPIAWIVARICGAKCLVYVHGLDLTVPNVIYRQLWLPVMRRMDGAIANSRATAAIAQRECIAKGRIKIVHPGVSVKEINAGARVRFRAELGMEHRKLLLSVGRLTRRKGLLEFIRLSLPKIVNAHPECLLVVIGDLPKNALFAEAVTPESIYEAATDARVRNNVQILGSQPDDVLSDFFQAADVHVFPVQNRTNDPEGFGMVAIEAAAHGLRTVAFSVGGVPDAVGDGTSGALVTGGDYTGFADTVIAVLNDSENPRVVDNCQGFAKHFAWDHFGDSLWRAVSDA
jgi:phosphatidyl-myo-inositol dimannoside synthase